jgi:hypothetical protein
VALFLSCRKTVWRASRNKAEEGANSVEIAYLRKRITGRIYRMSE